MNEPRYVGVDGCKGGWIAAWHGDSDPGAMVFSTFAELVEFFPVETIIAVDMPIGLPDRAGPGGRGPEALVRRHLGPRQSSVYSIPSRTAVFAAPGPFASVEDWYAGHRRASAIARETSDPPRGVSIQAFGIFSKIREIDALLTRRPQLRARIIESHPEAAFWRLNGCAAMRLPKKVKGRVNEPGMAERRELLARQGLPRVFVDGLPPRGAAADDFLDACAMLLIAERFSRGEAAPFPDPPLADSQGIPVAIWI